MGRPYPKGHSLKYEQNLETWKKLNSLLWALHDNQSDRMDIYHFTDTKDMWHVSSSKDNQWSPRNQCNPSDILYIYLMNLVSGFCSHSIQKSGRKQIAKKHYLPVHYVRKKQQKDEVPLTPNL